MKIRTQLLIGFALIAGFTIFMLSRWVLQDLRPRYLEMMEEGLVETANILATVLENEISESELKTDIMQEVFSRLESRELSVRIYSYTKERIDLGVYVTDEKGTVVYDSTGNAVGMDYGYWNNIIKTLRGEYGARSTRGDRSDPSSSILHVSAPVHYKNKIIGVLTVTKPVTSAHAFIEIAKKRFYRNVVICSLIAVIIIMILSHLVTRPIQKVTAYALKVRDGEKAEVPDLGRGEAGQLARSLEQMVETLEGKKYVETYLETLTHELKSPLSAVRSAAELLKENPPSDIREKFINNIHNSSLRMQHSVDQLLHLSRLENLKTPAREEFCLSTMCAELFENMNAQKNKSVKFKNDCPEMKICGDSFLIRMALNNLLENALDFTKEGEIQLTVECIAEEIKIKIVDTGIGIPSYALDKVEERFYSLPRPDTQKRSTGLGLSLVSRIAGLHGGSFLLKNRQESSGAEATFTIKNKID